MPLETVCLTNSASKIAFATRQTGSPHFFSGIQSDSGLPPFFVFPVRP